MSHLRNKRNKLFAAVSCGLMMTSVAADDYCFSGSYYNPARDGEGVNVEQIAEDAAVAYFYTYREGEEEFYVSVLSPLEDDPLAWFGPVTDTEYDGEFPVTGLDAIAGELLLEFKTEEITDGETVLGMEVVGFDAYLDLEQDLQREAGRSEDYAEGVRAFLGKRAPEYKGT